MPTAADRDNLPCSFLEYPLTHTDALARRLHAQQQGARLRTLFGTEGAEWKPMVDPVAKATRFTITAHETTNPRYPGGTAYFVAVDPWGSVKPNVFGMADTLAGAEYLAGMYMAAPTPTTRHGYLLLDDGLQPVVWTDKAARARFFKSCLRP